MLDPPCRRLHTRPRALEVNIRHWLAMSIRPNDRDILLAVDLQNGFLPGGSLAAAWAGMQEAGVLRVTTRDVR